MGEKQCDASIPRLPLTSEVVWEALQLALQYMSLPSYVFSTTTAPIATIGFFWQNYMGRRVRAGPVDGLSGGPAKAGFTMFA